MDDYTIRAFVRFLAKCDLLWHFDDCAHDVFGDKLDSRTCELLNQFANDMYAYDNCETAFDEAIKC